MNYYAARELQKDGKGTGLWHYTCMNDGRVWPVGYCSSIADCPDCKGDWGHKDCPKCKGSGCIRKDDSCPGHPSKEAAEEHYRQYLLDHMRVNGPKTQQWPKDKCDCKECNEEAKFHVFIPGHMGYDHQFCEAHANRAEMEKHVRVGESWSS